MLEHHQRAVNRLVDLFKDDPAYLALLIGGSVAKGLEKPDSDVDFMLVATDDEYARREPLNQFCYFSNSPDMVDYPGGYVDGKIVSLGFMNEVADHGSEPARWAFSGAIIACSRQPGLQDLLDRITVYPEQERTQKIISFYTQIQALKWFMSEAEKRSDPYLRMHAAADMVLFGGRLILAYNRMLYPYHKWFMTVLRRVPEKPEGLIDLAETLLAQPNQDNANRFADCVLEFATWDMPPAGWPTRFLYDVEWTWRCGRPAVEDL